MPVPGKLELMIKLNALPTEVATDKNGWNAFVVDCAGCAVTVTMRPKVFAKLTDAAAKWPQWVAAIAGQMGPATPAGFVLLEPNVQVFEKKSKAPAEGATTETLPSVPTVATPATNGTAWAQVGARLAQRLSEGLTLTTVAEQIGVPVRRLDELAQGQPSPLTPAQQATLLTKLQQVLA